MQYLNVFFSKAKSHLRDAPSVDPPQDVSGKSMSYIGLHACIAYISKWPFSCRKPVDCSTTWSGRPSSTGTPWPHKFIWSNQSMQKSCSNHTLSKMDMSSVPSWPISVVHWYIYIYKYLHESQKTIFVVQSQMRTSLNPMESFQTFQCLRSFKRVLQIVWCKSIWSKPQPSSSDSCPSRCQVPLFSETMKIWIRLTIHKKNTSQKTCQEFKFMKVKKYAKQSNEKHARNSKSWKSENMQSNPMPKYKWSFFSMRIPGTLWRAAFSARRASISWESIINIRSSVSATFSNQLCNHIYYAFSLPCQRCTKTFCQETRDFDGSAKSLDWKNKSRHFNQKRKNMQLSIQRHIIRLIELLLGFFQLFLGNKILAWYDNKSFHDMTIVNKHNLFGQETSSTSFDRSAGGAFGVTGAYQRFHGHI